MKSYDDFRKAVRQRESSGNYRVQNSGGCMGWYQFCPSTFRSVSKMLYGRVISKQTFLNSPDIQTQFFDKLIQSNLKSFGNIGSLLGKVRARLGNKITVSGLLAGAHLGGAGSVMKFANTGKDFKDGNGTPITAYMREFSGFQIPGVSEGGVVDTGTSNAGIPDSLKIILPIVAIGIVATIILANQN